MFELLFSTAICFGALLLLRALLRACIFALRAVASAAPVLAMALVLIWMMQSLAS